MNQEGEIIVWPLHGINLQTLFNNSPVQPPPAPTHINYVRLNIPCILHSLTLAKLPYIL